MDTLQEELILNLFKRRYAEFPPGEIFHEDKPDFIVSSTTKIGIELTQIFKDQDNDYGSFLRRKQNFKTKVLSEVVSKLKETEFPKCIFDINFNDKLFTGHEKSVTFSDPCFKNILFNREKFNRQGNYTIKNNGALPNLIKSYTLFVSPDFIETEFVLTGGSIGERLTTDHVQFILDKKEKAKLNYQKCNEYWLIIFEGSFEADHFGKLDIQSDLLATSFNKVFLLRQFEDRPILIK